MGTTNGTLAASLLRAMDGLGCEYRLLHKPDEVNSTGPTSDVDVILDRDARELAITLASCRAQHGLQLVMLWEYDRGAMTTFWLSRDGFEGVQLDLVHDPRGRGRYGLRTDAALRMPQEPGSTWPPHLGELPSSIYQLSKRILKGDRRRAESLVARLAKLPADLVDSAVSDLLSPARASAVTAARAGAYPKVSWPALSRLRHRANRRGLRRLVKPVGVVLPVAGDRDQVQAIADRWAHIFPRVHVFRRNVLTALLGAALSRRPEVILLWQPVAEASQETALAAHPELLAARLSQRCAAQTT